MIIYKITNLINGKVYVGQTRSRLRHRLAQHLNKKTTLVSQALRKYGVENFQIEKIDSADTQEELNLKEKYWIKKYNSISPNGYNIHEGGLVNIPTEETRKKISETLKGRFAGKNNPMYGKPSPMKGKPSPMKGRKHSEETIEKMKNSRSGINSKIAKKIINLDTGEIFISQKEASERYNINRSCICAACKGKQKTAGGFRWAYAHERC